MPDTLIPKDTQRWMAKVFSSANVGEICLGSQAALFLLNQKLSRTNMQAIAKRTNASVSCFISQKLSATSRAMKIRIFNSLTEIQVCGHGLLACAHLLNKESPDLFEQNTEISTEVILHSGQSVLVRKSNDQLWIGFEPLKICSAEIPLWIREVFSQEPILAAKVGEADGYWIFEWPTSYCLNDLQVNFTQLKALTQRAVIATQCARGPDFDFNLRYFAPQHGVNEDPATGSANRVLATYWSNKGLTGKAMDKNKKCNFVADSESESSQFRARQFSREGAVIDSLIEAGRVWISGQVALNDLND